MTSALLLLLPPLLQDPASLLAAQRAGLGDPAALAGLGTVRSRGKVKFEDYPAVGSFTDLLAPDGRSRQEVAFEGVPPAVRCTNGKLYWMSGTGGVEIKKGWSAAADVRLFALGRHRDWREVYARAELVGETQVGERACYELAMLPKPPAELGLEAVPGEEAPAPDVWWLDRDSKELVAVAVYATLSGAGWQRLVMDYSDWRTVAGVRFPFRTRLTFGPPDHQGVLAITCESLETHAKPQGDPFQPEDAVFAELARIASGKAANDPGFAVTQRKETLTASVRVRCKPEQLQQQLAIIFPEVMGHLNRVQVAPAGAPFTRYHAFGDEIDLEAGIPVSGKFDGNGRVKLSSLPGGEVVSGMHVGPYEELSRTHELLAQWVAAEGLTPQGGPWEVYWTDPGLERDPAKWRTELFQQVAPRPQADSEASPAPGAAPAGRSAALERLGIMVGTWKVTGGGGAVHGEVRFEWLEGGHFLIQRVDLMHGEQRVQGIEVIGHQRQAGEEPAAEITSRFYDSAGNTSDFVWEAGEGTLSIWGGQRGSEVAFHGRFSADRNTLTGAWSWPGGGLEFTSTRVLEAR
ncbi:MAG: hypothetical protein EYC70_13245 [Planctomycetota bacterium]|nr:MAG: hypothetical protein EYC70_13245 [Planctomycetota bacterium]